MRGARASLVVVAFLAATVLCFSDPASAQLSNVPVRLAFSRGAAEVPAGTTAPLKLWLRNFKNEETPAPEDIRVRVTAPELGIDLEVVIPKGQSSVPIPVTPERLGVARLHATATNLGPGQTMLLVTPNARASTSLPPKVSVIPKTEAGPGAPMKKPAAVTPEKVGGVAGAEKPPVAAEKKTGSKPVKKIGALTSVTVTQPTGAAPPPPLPQATPGEAGLGLQLEVQPEHVFPQGNEWRADVLVYVADRQQVPAPAPADAVVDLGAEAGTVSPSQIRIPAGQYSSMGQPIQIVSTRDGTDLLRARSTLGNAQKEVVYETPRPTRIKVSLSPKSVVNSGRSEVSVSVTLRDDEGRPAVFTDRDLDVQLSTSMGTLSDRTTKIPKGRFYADERKLQSAQSGTADVTAEAPGMTDTDSAQFRFPALLVGLAFIGGLLGAFVSSVKTALERGWLKHMAVTLVVGAIMGVVAYGLVLFGAVAAIPKVEINLAAIPTLNELGAFILGTLGGFGGRSLFERFMPK